MQNEAERVLRAMLLTCSSKAATNEGEEDEEDEEEQNKSGHLNLTVLFEKADIEEWLARILISMGDLYINQHQHQTPWRLRESPSRSWTRATPQPRSLHIKRRCRCTANFKRRF